MYITCILHKHSLIFVSFRSSILFYNKEWLYGYREKEKFPSPFGVQFSFIQCIALTIFVIFHRVSVSFRSSILFYDESISPILPCPTIVSVSFRSSILFYLLTVGPLSNPSTKSFRLLSEFNSLLWQGWMADSLRKCLFPSPFGVQFSFMLKNEFEWDGGNKSVSVSFRSSILFYEILVKNIISNILFPSPFGVQFSFIMWLKN